ncbi:complement factor H-related protein 4-like isoform X2 [Centropristis striata]|uniref:complement factor H-related protein 4-like isoform X2 n=1 Tax=Centropristis striata TaxID=184440 RepID=UPI0027E1FF24|nr:complement factor H-related protein 4-like isoform X2 [Centropristis striata]
MCQPCESLETSPGWTPPQMPISGEEVFIEDFDLNSSQWKNPNSATKGLIPGYSSYNFTMRLFYLLWLFFLLLNVDKSLQQDEVTCISRKPEHVKYWGVSRWRSMKLDETISYSCQEGYKTTAVNKRAKCTRNGWTPNPLCEELVSCGTPPPLKDGDIKYSIETQYSHNERVEYQCQSRYTMEGGPNRTCINGEWTGHMRCLEPCIVNEDDHRQHNITLKSNGSRYFSHDEIIDYRCARGIPVGAIAMRQRCNSGVLLLPSCQ